ncbi:MAG: hypothetical protein GXO71_00675 [Caldiserica bacterium]|nr:hypothetical protein [Caldisericota bacterium]
MRKKKAGWIILSVVVFLSFAYQVVLFSVTQKIKEELSRNGIKVRHISLGLVRGKIKISRGEGTMEQMKWQFSRLEANFSPLRMWKHREIEKVVIKGWKVTWRSNPSLPDPQLPLIKEVILKEGEFVIRFPGGKIKGKAEGVIHNIGEGRKAKAEITGTIAPESSFWIKGEFQLPDPNEYLSGKGEITALPLSPLTSPLIESLSGGKNIPTAFIKPFLQKSIPLFANLSFQGKLIRKEIELVALLEGKWGGKDAILRIKGKGKIPRINFSYQIEEK